MKNKDGGEGGGLLNFPPLKRGGGAYLRGGLKKGIYGSQKQFVCVIKW